MGRVNKITMALLGACSLGLVLAGNFAVGRNWDWATPDTGGYDWAAPGDGGGYDWALPDPHGLPGDA